MSDTANPTRGETSVTIEGVDYALRPTFGALAAIAQKLGRSETMVAYAVSRADLSANETAIVLCELIKAHDEANGQKSRFQLNPAKVARLIYEEDGGLIRVLATLNVILQLAISGGYTATGELKASTEQTSPPGATADA